LVVRYLRGRGFRPPHVVLGALTIVTFVGPPSLLIVRGGPSAYWPPDRAVEWFVVATVPLLAIVLMTACLTVAWWYPPDRWKPNQTNSPDPAKASN
jgi:hypothetical protein